MCKRFGYFSIYTAVITLTVLTLAIASYQAVAQYYIVGGELEAPRIKILNYTPLIIAGAAAAAFVIGIILASKLEGRKSGKQNEEN